MVNNSIKILKLGWCPYEHFPSHTALRTLHHTTLHILAHLNAILVNPTLATQPWTSLDNTTQPWEVDNPGQPYTTLNNPGQHWTTLHNPKQPWTTLGNPSQPYINLHNPKQPYTTLDNPAQYIHLAALACDQT